MYSLKNVSFNELNCNDKFCFFDSLIMLRFGETKVAKELFCSINKQINTWGVIADNMV